MYGHKRWRAQSNISSLYNAFLDILVRYFYAFISNALCENTCNPLHLSNGLIPSLHASFVVVFYFEQYNGMENCMKGAIFSFENVKKK